MKIINSASKPLKKIKFDILLKFRTIFRHIPCINGHEIDLYLLYWLVTAQGGWEKVKTNILKILPYFYTNRFIYVENLVFMGWGLCVPL